MINENTIHLMSINISIRKVQNAVSQQLMNVQLILTLEKNKKSMTHRLLVYPAVGFAPNTKQIIDSPNCLYL